MPTVSRDSTPRARSLERVASITTTTNPNNTRSTTQTVEFAVHPDVHQSLSHANDRSERKHSGYYSAGHSRNTTPIRRSKSFTGPTDLYTPIATPRVSHVLRRGNGSFGYHSALASPMERTRKSDLHTSLQHKRMQRMDSSVVADHSTSVAMVNAASQNAKTDEQVRARDSDGDDDVGEEDADEVSWTESCLDMLPLAVPVFVSIALTFGLAAVPLAFVGSKLGEEPLAGASVGYFIVSIVAQYPLCGLSFAMDALCSQEYGRDPKSDYMGVILQRAIIIGLSFVPLNAAILFIIYMVIPYIYDPVVVVHAHAFLKYIYLFIIPLVIFTAFSKFCTNQLLPQLPMIALVVGSVATPVVQNWLAPYGVEWACIGMAITAMIQLITIVILVLAIPRTRRLIGEIRIQEALEWDGIKEYLSLAGPSALFVAAEASAFDVTVLLAAAFGSAEGAAASVIFNMLFMFVSTAGGIGGAACVRVGASLGGMLPVSAKRFAVMAVIMTLVAVLVDSVIILTFYYKILGLFGINGDSQKAAGTVKWIVPLIHMADGLQFVFQGVFSGMGHNHVGAKILITCLWLVGIPMELLFGFVFGWGVTGLLIGVLIGLTLEWPIMLYYCITANWHKLAEEAQESDEEEDEEEDDEEEDDETEVDDARNTRNHHLHQHNNNNNNYRHQYGTTSSEILVSVCDEDLDVLNNPREDNASISPPFSSPHDRDRY